METVKSSEHVCQIMKILLIRSLTDMSVTAHNPLLIYISFSFCLVILLYILTSDSDFFLILTVPFAVFVYSTLARIIERGLKFHKTCSTRRIFASVSSQESLVIVILVTCKGGSP